MNTPTPLTPIGIVTARRVTSGGQLPHPPARQTKHSRVFPTCVAWRRFLPVVLCALFLAIYLSAAGSAYASTWPLASSGLSPSLSYLDSYTVGSTSYTHRGVDIAGSSGESISAPLSGTISFVGKVPSGDLVLSGADAEEATMNAVSIALDDGRTVTLMPFATTAVSAGDSVAEGQLLGTLAKSGDRSSSATHLHMGLKDSKGYYDPMALFGATSSKEASVSTADVSVAVSGVDATETITSTSISTSSTLESWSISTEEASEAATSSASVSYGTVTSGAASLAGVEQGASVGTSPLVTFAEACSSQAASLKAALVSMASALGVSTMALGAAMSSTMLVLIVALGMLAWRRKDVLAKAGAG